MQLSRVAQSLGRLAAAGCRVSRGAAADPRAAPMHSCNSKLAAALEEFRRCAYWNLREHSGLLRRVKNSQNVEYLVIFQFEHTDQKRKPRKFMKVLCIYEGLIPSGPRSSPPPARPAPAPEPAAPAKPAPPEPAPEATLSPSTKVLAR